MKLDSLVVVLREYQGILGTLLGVLLTLTATSLLRFAGKTSCQRTHWSWHMATSGVGDAKTIEQADSLAYVLDVDLFNPSDVPRGLRGFSVVIKAGSRNVVAMQQPDDSNTEHQVYEQFSLTRADPVRIVSLRPHVFQTLDLRGSFPREKNPLLFRQGTYDVTLMAADARGRKVEWKVAQIRLD